MLPDPDTLVVQADTREAARGALMKSHYDLALIAIDGPSGLPDGLFEAMARLPDRPEVIAILGKDDADRRAELVRAGVMAVLDPSVDDTLLRGAIATLIGQRRDSTIARLTGLRQSKRALELVSQSEALDTVLDTAVRVARAESSVLVLGETGVGKERIAELIHRSSSRSSGPFVTVNCAAIPTELFESELFGHEKGAFSARRVSTGVSSRWPTKARCSSTRSPRCRSTCRPSSYGRFNSTRSARWDRSSPSRSKCGWWPRPTATPRPK